MRKKKEKEKLKRENLVSDFLLELFVFRSSPHDIFLPNFIENYKIEIILNNINKQQLTYFHAVMQFPLGGIEEYVPMDGANDCCNTGGVRADWLP